MRLRVHLFNLISYLEQYSYSLRGKCYKPSAAAGIRFGTPTAAESVPVLNPGST